MPFETTNIFLLHTTEEHVLKAQYQVRHTTGVFLLTLSFPGTLLCRQLPYSSPLSASPSSFVYIFIGLKYLGRNLHGKEQWAQGLREPSFLLSQSLLLTEAWSPEGFHGGAQVGPSRLQVAKQQTLQVWKSLSTPDILSWQIGLSDLAAMERVTFFFFFFK